MGRIVTALILVFALSPLAQAQVRYATCSPGTWHRYEFETPPGTHPMVDGTLYSRYGGFLMAVWENSLDAHWVLASSYAHERLSQFSVGLLRNTKYALWIGCIRRSSYRVLVSAGKPLSLRYLGTAVDHLQPLSTAERTVNLDREAVMNSMLQRTLQQ